MHVGMFLLPGTPEIGLGHDLYHRQGGGLDAAHSTGPGSMMMLEKCRDRRSMRRAAKQKALAHVTSKR